MAQDKTIGEVTPAADQASSLHTTKTQLAARRISLKDFSCFLSTGNLSANAAQWLRLLTVGWLVLKISGGSALHSGTVVGIRTVPTLVLGPWSGVLADRWDRRKIAIITQGGLALAAILPASGQVIVWHAYMVTTGIGFTIKQPVRQALVANMANALALNALTVTSMRLVGPLIGGVLINTVGFQWNFIFEAGLYACMMLLLLLPMYTPY